MSTMDVMDRPVAPERSLQQRLDALEKANDIRVRRAALKRDLKARRVELVPLLLDPPAWLETAHVFDLLLAVPRIGRVKANKLLTKHMISPSKTVGGLSARQRVALVALMGER